ncbi:hypothetical protein I3843_07G213200 [Carya illinoinensis]|nr:hypothetical protein I3843_07G213200 [Carya illinoinensis]
MSNNLVSQKLSMPNMQMGQLEPILNKGDSSVQDMQMGLMASVSNVPAAHQHLISNKPVGLMDPFSSNRGFERLSMTSIQTVGREPNANNLGLMQFIPNKQLGPMETMLNNAGSQQLSASNKRKAPAGPLHNNIAMQELFLPNKRVAQLEHRPWLQQASGPNQSAVQMQYLSNTPGSQRSPTPVKKVVSSKSGSQRFSIPKNQTAALQPTSKGQTESFESVRSKMRESLASALALVSQQKDKSLSPKQNSHSDSASASGQTEKNSQLSGSLSAAIDAPNSASVEPKVTLLSHDDWSAQKSNNGLSGSARISAAEANGDFTHTLKSNGHETRSSYVFPGEDVSFIDDFFAKDELLQGNGLSWVLDSDMQVVEKGEFHTAQEQKLVYGDMGRGQKEEAIQSPQIVAFKIEAELFKLFGGVNKKYKEKGRSLLFNLKDRNNPELRERVMSSDIPPERLCSMTAEELASEELSQWRIAKAEESFCKTFHCLEVVLSWYLMFLFMVVHVVLVEGSPESEHAGLREVADSYVLDERVGFSEPAPGVELYFCPPQKRTREMLGNILTAEHIEALNNIDNGLIGVIVWRKAQLTSRISPNSSSHHKHKKQNVTSRRHQETNIDSSFKPKPPNPPRGLTPTNLTPSPDEDDDIPPGFGPRDEDDLPEFNFSGGSVPSSQRKSAQNISGASNSVFQTPARPVDQNQMRELIHKYGQPKPDGPSGNWLDNRGFGVAVQPWNDDDDDIPEWQPQQASLGQLPSSQQSSIHSFHQPLLRAHLVDQPPLGSAPQQPSHQAGTWWVPPVQGNSQQPSNLGCQPNVVGEFYGVPGRGVGQQGVVWRQNAPQNGGF